MALNLSALRALDTAELHIKHPITGDETGWLWTIAGPGHPQTLALNEKQQREVLQTARAKEQARVNGKKWVGDDKDPAEIRDDNVSAIAGRVLGFGPIILTDDGVEITYSPEAAKKILADPAYGWVFKQVLDFLLDDAAFLLRSDAR